MYLYTWFQWLLFFYIYCFIGWIIESAFVSLKCGHFVNRGFLRLPLLPLYGSGAVIMLCISLPFQRSLLMVFLSGMIGASVLEYITGWTMEWLFKMKYWDYTKQPFNLNGYICVSASVAWGFLTIILTEFVQQPMEHVILSLNPILGIAVCGVVSVLFAADAIQSTKEAIDLGRVLEAMTKVKTELEEIQQQMALLKTEAAAKFTTLKAETALRTEEKLTALKQSAERRLEAASIIKETAEKAVPDLSALTERIQFLSDKRDKLIKHFSFYRKSLLRGNPTASSTQFGEALKEIKEWMKNEKKSK